MTVPCPFSCENKTEFGYCKTTACLYAPTISVMSTPLPKSPEESDEIKIFYECNRHACVNCHDECRHTTNVLYAKNFSTDEKGRFWENITKEEQENGIPDGNQDS